MIRLGLRLMVAGGREAVGRLVLIVVAVAVGAALLLGTLGGVNAVQSQNDRYAWLETGYTGDHAPASARDGTLLWRLRADYFQGATIGRIDVAALGTHSPAPPPGMTALPKPGQFYASPALAALLRRTPRGELAARYPGHEAGVIGDAALPSPDSLIVIIGQRAAQLAGQPGVEHVSGISTTGPTACNCAPGVGTSSSGVTLILAVVAAALLFPVLILIGGATRLSAARREQRFAAMRLVGATPRQISIISTVESAVATVIGVAAGFALFLALRPALAAIPFTGERFFTSDVSLTWPDVLVVVVGLPIAAAIAARIALRRVHISPLGVTRRVTPRPPSAWRVLPLLAGIAELAYFAYVHNIGADSHSNPTVEALVFLAGVLLIMTGLVVGGPWLTMVASRLVVRRANRPATLIAARRLADNPQAGFRAISGLVLAVFIGTCATAIITAVVADNGDRSTVSGSTARTVVDMSDGPNQQAVSPSRAGSMQAQLTAIKGVTGVTFIRDEPLPGAVLPPGGTRLGAPVGQLVSCAQLTGVPALGHCAAGAAIVSINPDFGGGPLNPTSMADTVWQPADVTAAEFARLRIDTVVVGTDGSAAAVERTRTVLDRVTPTVFAPETIGEIGANSTRLLADYQRLAEIVILTSLPIAGCSLAVSIAGGLADRKRAFSLLRLSGTPLRVLRRIVGLEAAAPLLVTAVASLGCGLLAAYLFLRAQLGEGLHALNVSYYLYVVAGLAAALAVVASTLPLLNRLTGPEIARNE